MLSAIQTKHVRERDLPLLPRHYKRAKEIAALRFHTIRKHENHATEFDATGNIRGYWFTYQDDLATMLIFDPFPG